MEWRDIKGYEGYYQVSNTGLVKAISRTILFSDGRKRSYPENILSVKEWFENGKGYLMVKLTKQHKTRGFSVHRLVAEAFIPNPNNYPQVNHKDEDKGNNRAENLEWCDAKYNNRYSNSTCVVQYDKNWNVIKIWSCITEASETLNIPKSNIVNCCGKKLKSAGGYFWCYETDNSMSNELVLTEKDKTRKKEYSRRQYYKDVEKKRKQAREAYHRNLNENRARKRELYHKSIDKKRAYHRAWYQKHVDELRARAREKYKRNKQLSASNEL